MPQALQRLARRHRKRSAGRVKLSTTVSSETQAYLRGLVRSRTTHNLAEAVDLAVEHLRRAEHRAKLERETAEYFERLSGEQVEEESRLAAALDHSLDEIDFDR